ncbi:competence protein ComK [Bacillus sp. ISL-7]|uniref:competence protein ComK n=1 Tax=Bacillus sp. ISL-7 TaxID=2819136 RepID=UPI001BEB37BA|nr:competence protein ComK [Bacillus sp. ISL-7]MBT2738097.1 competence protein ComK [Bacillus sp. ISL-7]
MPFFISNDLKERKTIIIQKSYFIEKKMILLMGEYDCYGKLCARVMAGGSSFLVDRTPLQLLDDTLNYIGYDLRGAMASAKLILGERARCPIIVNPYLRICLFPNKSPHKGDCIWFSPEHIVRTKAMGNKTKVELSNGHSIIVDSKLTFFNNRIHIANQLMQISMKRGNHPGPLTFYLEPQKGHQLTKENTGKYNFSNLEDDHK